MTSCEIQKRINQDIEEYLNTYQVMLEYGRLLLDKDKEIRDKYKWIATARNGFLASIIIELIVGITNHIISNSEVEKSLPVVYSLLALSIIVWGFLFYLHRKKIACLINKDEKEKLSNLLSNLHLFLNQLHRWLKDVGYGRSPSKDRVENIRDELIIAHNRQIADVNKISTVYGKLDSELDKKAHEIATERLQPYIIYFYPYEE